MNEYYEDHNITPHRSQYGEPVQTVEFYSNRASVKIYCILEFINCPSIHISCEMLCNMYYIYSVNTNVVISIVGDIWGKDWTIFRVVTRRSRLHLRVLPVLHRLQMRRCRLLLSNDPSLRTTTTPVATTTTIIISVLQTIITIVQ